MTKVNPHHFFFFLKFAQKTFPLDPQQTSSQNEFLEIFQSLLSIHFSPIFSVRVKHLSGKIPSIPFQTELYK